MFSLFGDLQRLQAFASAFMIKIYRVTQEEGPIFGEVIVSAILSKKVCIYAPYSERFQRWSYFTVQFQKC
jgi:hypothetical protein